MTVRSLRMFFAALPLFLAFAGAARAEVVPLDSLRFSVAALREDYEIARHAYEEGHAGLYRFTSKRDLDRVFAAAERKLDHPMTAVEFYRVLAPVVVSFRCGHSRAEIPDTLVKELNSTRSLLPLQVRVLDGRLWVVRDLATEDERLAGRELLAVNAVPARQLLAAMLGASPRDGFGETMAPQSLRRFRFAGLLERLWGFDGTYEVTLRDAHGGSERVTLAGAPLSALQDRVKSRHPEDVTAPRAEFELLDDGRTASLRLRGFGGTVSDSDTTSIRTFFARSFAAMQEHGTRALVLDLRDNGGGEDALGKILFAYLVDGPFRYYDDLVLNDRGFAFAKYAARFDSLHADRVEKRADGRYHLVDHPNWGTQQPLEPHFGGRVIAIMNGASFSTTCEFLSHLRDARRGSFVGEESGGAYVGNTSGRVVRVTLPHTQVQVGVPILRYDVAVAPAKPFGRGILPDVAVQPTIADLLAGRDPELAKALELARQ